MKSLLVVCLAAGIFGAAAWSQGSDKPALQKGVTVQMATAMNAVEVPAADKQDATVVAITSDGRLFVGVEPAQLSSLAALSAHTIYLKADARVPYQKLLPVLDALHGGDVVLLTAPISSGQKSASTPPYGIEVTIGR
jgi:hypothetical protein